jgi:predicted transcriptional regulator
LGEAAESVLLEGESPSGFVEQAIPENIARRQNHSEFVARGLTSREEAKRSGDYVPAEEVLARLNKRLDAAKARGKTR